MIKPVIRLDGVHKNFSYWSERPTSIKTMLVEAAKGRFRLGFKRKFTVLEDISFEIASGEFVGIMGRNGAGKSTVLKLVCGIYEPSSGKVEVNAKIAPLIELGAGFNEELSGYENIFLNAAILGFGRRATLDAVQDIISFSELGEMINMPVKNYSSGMRIRLGFSIATHLTAPVLLVDEVLAVGDAGFQEKCLKKIQQLHSEGRTIVLVTHDAEAVRRFCKRCIVLEKNKKVFDGSPAQGSELYLQVVKTGEA